MRPPWMTRTVVGIVLATFWSDVGHEMVTAVLPLYLASIGLGAAALGAMEGAADLAFSLSKLAGGVIGHRVERKQPWMVGGYLLTAAGTGAIALVRGFGAVVSLRTAAWAGRGIRSPMRDFLLADEVEATHFGRAYGIERTADMLGALAGPLIAALLVWVGLGFDDIILWSLIPSGLAVLSVAVLTRDRPHAPDADADADAPTSDAPAPTASLRAGLAALPPGYWRFVGGVLLFGLGDFSRTFLILLAATTVGEDAGAAGTLTTAVLLYAGHNLISAIAAYPAGVLGDRGSKPRILLAGYALGVGTNLLLAFAGASLPWLIVAIAVSGIYIAVEETLEKAVVAGLVPRAQRSLGLGVLAAANALGDFGSSVFVGIMLATGHPTAAFLVPAGVGALGVLWMAWLTRRGVI